MTFRSDAAGEHDWCSNPRCQTCIARSDAELLASMVETSDAERNADPVIVAERERIALAIWNGSAS